MLFDQKIIILDEELPSATLALTRLADSLQAAGQVNDQFKAALLTRERQFPTGLQTKTLGVALPHAAPEFVEHEQLGLLRLKRPVIFRQMGDNAEVAVQLVFILALKEPQQQLAMLQALMQLFQNEAAVQKLMTLTDQNDIITLLASLGIK